MARAVWARRDLRALQAGDEIRLVAGGPKYAIAAITELVRLRRGLVVYYKLSNGYGGRLYEGSTRH